MKVRTPPIDSTSGISSVTGCPTPLGTTGANVVLEASIGYAASCGVVVMDEVASLNKRVEDGLEQRKEEGAMTMRRVRDLEDSLANKQEARL